MSSGASEAPNPTIASPAAGRKVLTQEHHHAFPRLLGRRRVVGRALLVGEGVCRVIAVDLRLVAAAGHRLLEVVHDLRGAPVVGVGEMALDGNLDLRRIGELSRRHAIEWHAAGDAGHARRGGDGEGAAHAEPHHAHLAAHASEMLHGAGNVLVGGADEVEPAHHVVGLVRLLRHAALVEVGRQRVVAR
jgi:hypothetical protein